MKEILKFIVGMILILLVQNTVIAEDEIFIEPNIKNKVALESFVDGLINGQLKTSKNAAVTLSIVKDGELLLSKSYGLENIEGIHLTPSKSLFRIGSTSKTITYTAIMQLNEQGKLDLDANVNSYLKDFKIPDTFKNPITIKHILNHTAGFEDGMLGHLFISSIEQIIPLREALEKYMPERIYPVGKYSAYSNFAVSLLGVVIEDVTGIAFDEYIDANIFKPLAMNRSTFKQPLPEFLKSDMTYAYTMVNDIPTPKDFELITNYSPAGGMSSTANDMAQYMMMNLNDGELAGNRILQSTTAKLMQSTSYSPNEQLTGMAHGFMQINVNDHLLFGHKGNTMHFATDMVMDTSENLGIYISSTAGNKITSSFVQKIYDRYFPQTPVFLQVPADFSQRAEKYRGEYLSLRSNFTKIEKLLQLTDSLTVAPAGNMLLISGTRYVEVGKHLFQQLDGKRRVIFIEDKNGNIVDLNVVNMPHFTWSKAPFYTFSGFNLPLLGLSQLVFFIVLLGFLYRRKEYKQRPLVERKAIYISVTTACTNIAFLLIAVITGASLGSDLYFGLPTVFKIALLLPIIATVLAFVQLYFAVSIWKNEQWSIGKRINYSVVTACAFFMAWFYFFWNILGYQYM